MPTFPAFDLTKFELPKFDVSKFDVSKFELPTFDLPKFDLSKFDMTKVELPAFDLPKIQAALPHVDSDRVVGLVRDVAYAGIGLTVLAVEQAEHGRRTLQDAVTRGARKVAAAVA